VIVVPVMVIDHLIPTAKSIPEITAFVARAIRVAESVMPIWIRRFVGIDVVASRFNSVMEAAVPGTRPVALRFVGMPTTLLGVNGERRSA
jgi:hypothetical protein